MITTLLWSSIKYNTLYFHIFSVLGMSLNGQPITNNSIVLLHSIGEGNAALLCTTNKTTCCGTAPNRFGEWRYPDRIVVPNNGTGQPYYRNRDVMLIRLNRRFNQGLSDMYTGVYCCEIPDQNDVNQTLCVGAYPTETAGESVPSVPRQLYTLYDIYFFSV